MRTMLSLVEKGKRIRLVLNKKTRIKMKKTTTVRLNENVARVLAEIDEKPTTAGQIALQVFASIRKAELAGLKEVFTRSEVIAMADAYNGCIPIWHLLGSKNMLLVQMEDAEKYESAISKHEAKPEELFKKINSLTSAQAAILQLELYNFWNNTGKCGYGSPAPDLEKLVEKLS